MSHLILTHPNDNLNISKEMVPLDNWRVVASLPKNGLLLITHDCRVYKVQDLTIPKFKSMLALNLDLSKTGVFHAMTLTCPNCNGSGVTDWISEVVSEKMPKYAPGVDFERDKESNVWRTHLYFNNKRLLSYVSKASIPEARQHCGECKGTGLFSLSVSIIDYEEKIFNVKFG